MLVRGVLDQDHTSWMRLWDDYNRFYEARVALRVTEHTWQRILDPASPLLGRIAERNGRLVGMTNSVLHEGTWSISPTLYLEDLFVHPGARGGGIGRALMVDIIDQAKARGCSQLYWHTRADNATARHLYNTFTLVDDFVRYRMVLGADS